MRPRIAILICGGRSYSDATTLETRLDHLVFGSGWNTSLLWIVEGACHLGGADELAYQWRMKRGLQGARYPVNRSVDGPWPAAGNRRNGRMYEDSLPLLTIGFPGGNGTKNMLDYASRRGCPLVIENAGTLNERLRPLGSTR